MVSKDTRGGLRVMQAEYAPLKAYKKKVEKVEKVKFGKPEEKSAGLAALAPQDKVDTSRSTIVLTRNWTAQGVVDKLSVMQARELYDLLKKIFGG
jgi:phosphoserine aminotransferase